MDDNETNKKNLDSQKTENKEEKKNEEIKKEEIKKEENKKEENKKEEDNNDKKDNKIKLSLNRTFSYINRNKPNNEQRNKSKLLSFYEPMTKYLKEQLEHDSSFCSDFNKSHNYLPKISRDLNSEVNKVNSNSYIYNNQSLNNESLQNDSLNFNVNPNMFFGVYNQLNQQNNESSIIENNNESNEVMNNNKENINNHDDKLNILLILKIF